MGHKQNNLGQNKYTKTHGAIAELGRQLPLWLIGPRSQDFDRISVRQRGPSDYVAVFKVDGDDGTPLVAFGNGPDFVSAIMGLEGAITANRFKVDQPWLPPENAAGSEG